MSGYPAIVVPSWVEDAICPQTDPEMFFPSRGGPTKDAKRVCGMCPVRAQCLEWALEDPDLDGIWGGTSYRERQALRKTRNKPEGAAA
jgi:WhiB family redox-sensing transcriptional regulator